jgi:hypothetical protein
VSQIQISQLGEPRQMPQVFVLYRARVYYQGFEVVHSGQEPKSVANLAALYVQGFHLGESGEMTKSIVLNVRIQ